MKASLQCPVAVIGAGLAGALLARLLARRGFAVTLFERRADPRVTPAEGGRSINLALSERGIRALRRADMFEQVAPLLQQMRGRMVHERDGRTGLQPYGQRPEEVIYSVERAALNNVLVTAAERAGVTLRFEQRCVGLDPDTSVARCLDERSGRSFDVECETVIAADGAGSAVRASLVQLGSCVVRCERLEHDYKELTLPALSGAGHALESQALHIWPRGRFMLIALPNLDGSFTMTMFLPRTGEPSFAALAHEGAIGTFFAEHFPDLSAHHRALIRQFRRNRQGTLSTVYAQGWSLDGRAVLLGDAAHAIVPFHGQGMNAAFEDCAELDRLLGGGADWATAYAEFERVRRPSTDAIARMALENYFEMRESVSDLKFQRLKRLAFELEHRFPGRFIPRYSMVMFHPEITYLDALRQGETQRQILERLDRDRTPAGEVDASLAAALVHERLPVRTDRDPEARTG